MMLTLGSPSPLASWEKELIVIPGLEDSGRYTCRTFYIKPLLTRLDTSSRPIIKEEWVEVHAKVSVLALTPSPLAVRLT